MLHFPSTFVNTGPGAAGGGALPRRTDSLNATQHKSASHEIFLTIEEELHDARRVQMHGQEEDLRAALSMVIERVGQLSNLLSEAYKAQAELEVQLNVAKSNLQLVISNNEMLEEALKRDTHAREVGWRRGGSRTTGGRAPEEPIRSASADYSSSEGAPPLHDADAPASSPVTMATTPTPTTAAPSESRFFTKFRFTSSPHPSATTAASSRPTSRPGTPQPQDGTRSAGAGVNGAGGGGGGAAHHLSSPSLPSLPTQQSQQYQQKIEELNASLEKERAANAKATQEKAALEAELESLSQALFEEANKMVATERIKRAETEEELKEANLEKEALKSALRLLEDQSVQNSPAVPYTAPPTTGASAMGMSSLERDRTVGMSHSRSSSREAVKSLPSGSPPPLSPTFLPESLSMASAASSSTSESQAEPGPGEEAVNPSNPSKQDADDRTRPRPAESTTLSSSPPPTRLEPVRDKHGHDGDGEEVEDSEPTPQFRRSRPSSLHLSYPIDERSASPWADVVRVHAQSSVADPASSFPTGQTV